MQLLECSCSQSRSSSETFRNNYPVFRINYLDLPLLFGSGRLNDSGKEGAAAVVDVSSAEKLENRSSQ